MNTGLNETHDPHVQSWLESANDPSSDFPLQNLPFGIYRRRGGYGLFRMGVAIGDSVLDVAGCDRERLLPGLSEPLSEACRSSSLNSLMALSPSAWSHLRRALWNLLRANHENAVDRQAAHRHLAPIDEIELSLPVEIGDYTDFYASIEHATNVGRLFRPQNPLLPNYKYMPIAYHGRASSIQASGACVRRPRGQTRPALDGPVRFGPSERLDFEAEIGFFVGPGNPLGRPISLEAAEAHIFGLCIVNDWSARDIQAWEYQPLGPFLGKSFATTISPWVVTLEALAPFRIRARPREQGDPDLLSYLSSREDQERGAFNVAIETWICSDKMREHRSPPVKLSQGNMRDLFWTPGQMLAHHTSNGCNLRPGDLLATGTISGGSTGAAGCLLELTRGGVAPVSLPMGEQRHFLEDGDEILIRANCSSPDAVRIGFGSCRGFVQP